MVLDPRKTALPTLVLTPISAAVGLIDTAPSDQLELALNVSESGTLGAPVRALPLPVTSGGSLAPQKPQAVVVRFHSETCGPGIVVVSGPPIASVSRIMPFTTLGTFSCEYPAAAPSADVNELQGTV